MAPLRIIANSWVAKTPAKPVAGRGRKPPAARANEALQKYVPWSVLTGLVTVDWLKNLVANHGH